MSEVILQAQLQGETIQAVQGIEDPAEHPNITYSLQNFFDIQIDFIAFYRSNLIDFFSKLQFPLIHLVKVLKNEYELLNLRWQ